VQLRAKQKLKRYYANIVEKQFRGIYDEAIRMKGDSGANMIGLLERRLDAIVYRAKFVPTIFAARQFVNHGHVKVNGKRVNIASYRCKLNDVVEVKDASKEMALVLEAKALAERDVPDYLEVDHSKMTAKLARVPAPSATRTPISRVRRETAFDVTPYRPLVASSMAIDANAANIDPNSRCGQSCCVKTSSTVMPGAIGRSTSIARTCSPAKAAAALGPNGERAMISIACGTVDSYGL
jgi:ribosomal protein S4